MLQKFVCMSRNNQSWSSDLNSETSFNYASIFKTNTTERLNMVSCNDRGLSGEKV